MGELVHLLGGGWGRESIGLLHGVADAEVAGGENVGALEGEDEEHVGSPDADAFDLGEAGDDFFIGERGEFFEDEFAIAGVAGQVADIGGFLGGETEGAHARRAQFEDGGGSHGTGDGGGEAAEDDAGDASAQLLVDDGVDKGLKIGLAKLDTIISNPLNDAVEHRVAGSEVANGLLHSETLARRGAS